MVEDAAVAPAVGSSPRIPSADEAAISNVQYSAPADPSESSSMAATAGEPTNGEAPKADEPKVQAPIVKSDWDKTPRNAPCPCGSGKKFKQCHGG